MQAFRLANMPGQGLEFSALPLQMPQASGIIDPEPFRARARGEGLLIPEQIAPCGGLRSLHLEAGQAAPLFDLGGPLVTIVASGSLHFTSASGEELGFGPGDLFLVDAHFPSDLLPNMAGGCRLVQFRVADDWPGERARPVIPGTPPTRNGSDPKLKRMSKGLDGRSSFREFATLFGPPGTWSEWTPMVGVHFIGMAADLIIDWHPEVVNNLVIVLTGGLELEVGGGGGGVEVFYPGDICLAEDRTGEGHIDRTLGYVQVCVLIVEDENLWAPA